MAHRSNTGQYAINTPVNLYQFHADLYNMIFFGREDLKNTAFLLNHGLQEEPSETNYDCFNWSLGFRSPQVIPEGPGLGIVTSLYDSYGFVPCQTEDDAQICLFIDRLNKAIHAHVKQTVTVNGSAVTLWTSKLGTDPYLIGYPKPADLLKYYATHNARKLVYFKRKQL